MAKKKDKKDVLVVRDEIKVFTGVDNHDKEAREHTHVIQKNYTLHFLF